MPKLFFSFVIPAHNEAKYLGDTLGHLKHLDYPADRFEVIVVENGSSDGTFELAKTFERDNFKALQSGKGVSRAKNAGIDHLAPYGDWVIFLDADTTIEPPFLGELNAFLQKPNTHSVGTVSLQPLPETAYARAWFFVHNVGHMLSKTSFAIKLVRRDLFPSLRFNEQLTAGEDIDMIRRAQTHGSFFYLWTKNVATSTRRFERIGWWRLTLSWTLGALMPVSKQEDINYEVLR